MDILQNLGEAIKETLEDIKNDKLEKKNLLKNSNISSEELELAQKLDAVQEYTLDRYEGNIAVLENRKTGKMENVDKSKLPDNLEEGSILKCINGKYIFDKEKTEEISTPTSEPASHLLHRDFPGYGLECLPAGDRRIPRCCMQSAPWLPGRAS